MKGFSAQIVDENDQIIGHKKPAEIDFQNDIYRVAALWLTNSKQEILLAQRKYTKNHDPGKWGPAAAGTLEEGETYESNIYKEAQEEIGLTGVKFKKGPKIRIKQPRNYFCQWFLANADKELKDFELEEAEVETIRWSSLESLIDDLNSHPDKYVPSLPLALRYLNIT